MKPPAIHTIKGTRILLVEDNELNAEIAKTVLEDVGSVDYPSGRWTAGSEII